VFWFPDFAQKHKTCGKNTYQGETSMSQDLQHFITEHCKRIATLQNSQDPNKHALIALLAKEIGQAKEKLA
jgi:hypothetical protein